MKKMILMMVWSITCLASMPIADTIAMQKKQQAEKEQKELQRPHELPNEIVDSLIEHAPALIKECVQFINYSVTTGEVRPKTLFFHGPSGVGKTETAIALAQKVGIPFTVLRASSLGDERRNSVKTQLLERLMPIINSDQNHVIIVDNCALLFENYDDAKGSYEDNMTATAFCHLLDACVRSKHILIIGVSNSIKRCPDRVRTRFGSLSFVEFKMPGMEARKRILRVLMPKDYSCSEEVLTQLARATEGISPRDFKHIIDSVVDDLEDSGSGRTHFVFNDFKEDLEQSRKINAKEGIMSKMAKQVVNRFVEKPISTISGAISTAASAASVLMMFMRR